MKRLILGFILIISIAGVFRIYKLSSAPISYNWDEVAFAYNSYSLLQTGKDEYGTKIPLEFKSVGDYKAPMYIYLLVPAFWLIGPNDMAVRIVPVFLGILSTGIFFLIVRKLVRNYHVALVAGLMLAISPWHLQFTRAGADVAVGTFFVMMGLALFLTKRINLSAIMFSGAIYSYFAERFFIPAFSPLLIWYSYKKMKVNTKQYVFGFITAVICLLPIITSLMSPGAQNKVLITTVLSYKAPEELINKMTFEDGSLENYSLFHNLASQTSQMILTRYANHFSPSFLFINGPTDNRQRIQSMGMLYWTDAIWLIAGAVILAYGIKAKNKNAIFIAVWLAITPLAASITKDAVHARRAFNMIYPLTIVMALGLVSVFRKVNIIIKISLIGATLWFIAFYLISYYQITPKRTAVGSAGWQFGYKQLVEYITPISTRYKKVIVDTSYQGPYIFFLWYQKYPPKKYQPQANLVKKEALGLGEGTGYDQFEFRDFYWPAERGNKGNLYAGSPEKIPLKDIDAKQARILNTIYFPSGEIAYYIVETY